MGEVAILRGDELRKILQSFIDKEIPTIMSYLSNGKWHVAKVLLRYLGATKIDIEVASKARPHPINIRVGQPVGISIKYGYGKFIFEASVIALEPSLDHKSGGTIAMTVPTSIEIVQRRNYFRVNVPNELKVNVMMWHRRCRAGEHQISPGDYWDGRLIDISAGGAQVTLDASGKPDFKIGQFVGFQK